MLMLVVWVAAAVPAFDTRASFAGAEPVGAAAFKRK
jgi:hypothetical protein